ncbi:protein of unknown function (plasmid) [Rhodovastum atsumiense]|uniref:HypC/HybG/HupF family hydrogenase formation chaperone n=1 Tax=Rhodovastum atsumiense TaxID=504468 RepID=UPI002023CCCD|nr:HypC/HybG/HupF family hydrogenase formation chaperone [Rhodovastum atsumiense]CAH2605573.1 protein of unknown function [Rhodovastum atsumiense]
MCIALPRKIVAVLDAARLLVAVRDDEDGQEAVSAALLVTPERPVEQLVGAFALVHAGFALSLVDEADAHSRLQMFAALRGEGDSLDLDDFYAATSGPAAPPPPALVNATTADPDNRIKHPPEATPNSAG